MKPKHCNKH